LFMNERLFSWREYMKRIFVCQLDLGKMLNFLQILTQYVKYGQI
jgi:hypothetical protein